MIQDHVVFVLGAGASVPFGFPSGKNLVRDILRVRKDSVPQALDGLMCDAVCERLDINKGLMRSLQTKLLHSQVSSIDEFLAQECHHSYVDLGRFLIAALLAPKEDPQRLFEDGAGSNRNWYQLVWSYLRDYGSMSKIIARANVTFVTFNYDRSLEHYLYTVMRHHFDAESSTIERYLGHNIFHVHGSLGSYRGIGWGKDRGKGNRQYTSHRCTIDDIVKAMKGVSILHEVEDFPHQEEITARIEGADRIVFIGFQYHRDNIIKLFKNVRKRHMVVGGSSFDLSAKECNAARTRIATCLDMTPESILIKHEASGLGCYDYLRNHFDFS